MKYALLKIWRRFFPLAEWCNPCESCGGTSGFVSSYDPSPSGVALGVGSYWDWDTCRACADKSICPGCGTQLSELDAERVLCEKHNPCPFCRWTVDKGSKHYRFDTETGDDIFGDWPDDRGYGPYDDDLIDAEVRL